MFGASLYGIGDVYKRQVSSYIMAKNMRSDSQLAAQILVGTTFVSPFTMCVGIYLLRSFGFL